MEYNTQRTQLHLPEYGRIIQQLVERCKEMPTKEERSELAAAIVELDHADMAVVIGLGLENAGNAARL